MQPKLCLPESTYSQYTTLYITLIYGVSIRQTTLEASNSIIGGLIPASMAICDPKRHILHFLELKTINSY